MRPNSNKSLWGKRLKIAPRMARIYTNENIVPVALRFIFIFNPVNSVSSPLNRCLELIFGWTVVSAVCLVYSIFLALLKQNRRVFDEKTNF